MADIELVIKMPEEKYNKFMYSDDVDEEELVEAFEYLMNGTPIPDNAVTWVDFEHLRDKIIRLSCRYSIARERGCGGQVEWSDRLIKQEDVLKAFEEYQKGGKE